MNLEDRASCSVAAAVLARGHMLHQLAVALAILALVALLALGFLSPIGAQLQMAGMALTLLASLCETLLAARVALDTDLFRSLAAGELDLATLDAGLRQLAMVKRAKLGRPLAGRLAGAMRLLELQAGCLLVEALIVLAVASLRLWRPW
jgi:hypothetical protein